MPIQCQCPSCGQTLRVPDSAIGKMVRCPKCQETFTAASSEAEEPPQERRPPRRNMELEQEAPPPPPPPPSRRRGMELEQEAPPPPPPPPPPPSRRDDRDAEQEERRPARRRDEEDRPRRRDEEDRRRERDDDDDSPRRRDYDDRRDHDDRDQLPARRGSYDDRDDYDDDRRGRPAYDDYDEDNPPMRRGGRMVKPSSVQTAGILMLIGGILALLGSAFYALFVGASSAGICCLYPGYVYALVSGILAIVRGSQLLGDNAYRAGPGTGIAIMLILNVLNFDLLSMTMGIVALVMLNNDESRRYFGR